MSPRLDLPIAAAAWLLGFWWIGRAGTWTPLLVLAVAAAVRLVAGDPVTRRLLRPGWSGLVLGVAGAAGVVATTYGLFGPLGALFPGLTGATRDLYRVLNAAGSSRATLGAMVVIMSVCEEVVWRGRTLAAGAGDAGRLDGPAVARVAVLALCYGAASLTSGSLVLFALSTGCGFAWGLLRVAGRSLWPAILAHAAWDLAVLVGCPLG
jgi:membrane protease YdiL (CAAX protease family)